MPDSGRDPEGRAIGRTLAAGVYQSGLLIAAGLVLSALGSGGQSWIKAGIIALIAIPYIRVIQLGAMFARRREWRFTALSAAVLSLMGIGAALGLLR